MHSKVLLCIFVTTICTCTGDPTTIQEMEAIQSKCQEEYGITDEMFLEMRSREMILEDESDDFKKCLIECMLVGLGMIKNGDIDVITVMNVARPIIEHVEDQGREVDEEGLKLGIRNCSLSNENDKCSDGYGKWKCLHDLMSKIMIPAPEIPEIK